jgi:hypothetical protein
MSGASVKTADLLLLTALALAVGGLVLEANRGLVSRRAFAEPLREPRGPPSAWWRKAPTNANAASSNAVADPHDDPEARFATARDAGSFQ